MKQLKVNKIRRKVWKMVVQKSRLKSYYPKLYFSYWHLYFCKISYNPGNTNYYTAAPNPDAGIGHQLANWISGYWFAQKFELKFAHSPFSQSEWERLLGFYENEITVKELIKLHGYKKVKLPQFHEFKSGEVDLNRKIIDSYKDKKVVFVAEQDQSYGNQFGVMKEIRQKFHNAKARRNDNLLYSNDNFNIALHIRRGDIVLGHENGTQNHQMRWQNNDYFFNILSLVIENLKLKIPVSIYIFSQGEEKDFKEFKSFKNVHFCLDMSAKSSFLHMVYADLLITSKSSFSYKPALLSSGLKLCPKNFWHGYPDNADWILADEDGTFDTEKLKSYFKSQYLSEIKVI